MNKYEETICIEHIQVFLYCFELKGKCRKKKCSVNLMEASTTDFVTTSDISFATFHQQTQDWKSERFSIAFY